MEVVRKKYRNVNINFVQIDKSIGSWELVLHKNICPQFDPVLGEPVRFGCDEQVYQCRRDLR